MENPKEEIIVISLGGSTIVPDQIDTSFLSNFRNLIISQVEKGKRFVLITGGGKVCRRYQDSAKEIKDLTSDELDWIGIATTRFNAEFVRILFGELAYEKIIMDPDIVPQSTQPIMLGGGWKPGNSSDLASVRIAKSLGAKKIFNLSNIDYVYDKDPNKYPDAVKIDKISWADFRKILPTDWDPGLNAPFDPIAAQEAEALGMEVFILNGKNISNLEKCLNGEEYEGTQIS